jgi:cytoskeletal protein CcmA (bactofilin family)
VLILAVFAVLGLAAPAVYAAEPRVGDTVTIAATETIEDDVYLIGTTITIDGVVQGDVVALGQTIIVNGSVQGSLMVGGNNVFVNGQVGRSVRAGGYSVIVGPQARIEKDVLVGAYHVAAEPGSQIGGDVWAGSAQARLYGEIGQDYLGSHTALDLNGTIHGNVTVNVNAAGEPSPFNPGMFVPNAPQTPVMTPGFRLGDQAHIDGILNYTSPTAGVISPNANVQGGVRYTVNETATRAAAQAAQVEAERNSVQTWLLNFGRDLATLLLVGLLLMWLAPAFLGRVSNPVTSQPLASLGWGIVVLVGVPFVILSILVAAIALAAGLGALQLGGLAGATVVGGLVIDSGLLLTFIVVLAWLSKLIVGLAIGQRLMQTLAPTYVASRVWPMALGVLLVALLIALPYVGTWVNIVVTLMGMGTLALVVWESRRRATPGVMSPAPLPA